jgi:hypothetical protein
MNEYVELLEQTLMESKQINDKFVLAILGKTWKKSNLKPEDVVKWKSDLGDINIVVQYKGNASDHGKIAKMKSKKQDLIWNKVQEMDNGYKLSKSTMKTMDDGTFHMVFSFDKE